MEQTQTPLQPKLTSASEFFKNAIAIFEGQFKKIIGLLGIQLLAMIPAGIIVLLHTYLKGGTVKNIVLGILGVLAFVISFYITISVYAAIVTFLKKLDANLSVTDLFKEGREKAWQYLSVSFVTGLFVLLWSLLLIVPGIIFAVYYSFSIYSSLVEGYKVRSAIKRSKELVKDYWWAIAGRNVFFGLILLILYLILSIPFLFFREGTIAFEIWSGFINLIQFVLGPLYTIFNFLIFKELIKIKGESKLEGLEKYV